MGGGSCPPPQHLRAKHGRRLAVVFHARNLRRPVHVGCARATVSFALLGRRRQDRIRARRNLVCVDGTGAEERRTGVETTRIVIYCNILRACRNLYSAPHKKWQATAKMLIWSGAFPTPTGCRCGEESQRTLVAQLSLRSRRVVAKKFCKALGLRGHLRLFRELLATWHCDDQAVGDRRGKEYVEISIG